jgi:rfaE bifunctional protein nucleotidyltransferase chain/domain
LNGHQQTFSKKIELSAEALAKKLKLNRESGLKVVMCHGVFDPIHPGHILHLQAAKQLGDVLVVSVTSDRYVNKGPWRPVFAERLRAQTLASLEDVDHVIVNDAATAVELIRTLQPNAYVKGSDYEDASKDITGKINDEAAAVQEFGGRIEFTHEESNSSSSLINRFFSTYPEDTQKYLEALRNKYSAEEVIERLQAFKKVRPVVIAEVILDEYCYVDPLAKAPRESVIAARYRSLETFAGGGAATANHIAGYCDEVTFIGMIGPDPAERAAVESRLAPNVRFLPVITPDRQTVTKRRFLDSAHLTKLFEVQNLEMGDIIPETEAEFQRLLEVELPKHDMVMVNDFGHGFLTESVRSKIMVDSPFLALNTQTNSANLGFNMITNYAKADYCCIDLAEARLASRSQHSTPLECGQRLLNSMSADSFMITTGQTGSIYQMRNGENFEVPALSPQVIDRVGAGDAFFAVTSPWVFLDNPKDLTGFIGNSVGAMQVAIVGNRNPVEATALYKFISSVMK